MTSYKVNVKGEVDYFNSHEAARKYAIRLLEAGVTLIEITEEKE